MQVAVLRRKRTASASTAAKAFTRDSFPAFDSEAELVTMIRGLFAENSSQRWFWIAEFVSPSGIADLAAVQLTSDLSTSELRRVPARWLYALKLLSAAPFSLEGFAALTNVTLSAARGALKSYQDAGFCVYRPDQGTWLKVRDPRPVAEKIIAIEAKLSDWRRALYQSCRYTDYASESWVVLDSKAFSSARLHLDEFQHRGIGLAGLSSTGEFELACAAQSRGPRLPQRFWQANAEIARHLAASRL